MMFTDVLCHASYDISVHDACNQDHFKPAGTEATYGGLPLY
jgi:hypothetical protein